MPYIRLNKIGDCVSIFSPLNEDCGHDFYQFSPEFFKRVFQGSNGFKVVRSDFLLQAFIGPHQLRGRGHSAREQTIRLLAGLLFVDILDVNRNRTQCRDQRAPVVGKPRTGNDVWHQVGR